jgi:hypothetical protein
VAQLLLYHSRGCTVCKERTGCTMPHRMEPAAWYAQLITTLEFLQHHFA